MARAGQGHRAVHAGSSNQVTVGNPGDSGRSYEGFAGQDLPSVPRIATGGSYSFPGSLEPNTVFCIETYAGDPDTRQGVKLEDDYLITESGLEKLSTYP
jgi:hypothetical protein